MRLALNQVLSGAEGLAKGWMLATEHGDVEAAAGQLAAAMSWGEEQVAPPDRSRSPHQGAFIPRQRRGSVKRRYLYLRKKIASELIS